MVSYNRGDLDFILQQIKIAEALKDPASLPEGTIQQLIPNPLLPWGLRTVDGTYNNIIPGRENWGSADQEFIRLLEASYRDDADGDQMPLGPPGSPVVTNTDYGNSGHVADADPRIISNLIVDQSVNNKAAVMAALTYAGSADPSADADRIMAANVTQAEADAAVVAAQAGVAAANTAIGAATLALTSAAVAFAADPTNPALLSALLTASNALTAVQGAVTVAENALAEAEATAADPQAAMVALAAELGVTIENGSLVIPNVAPDEGISAPFNSWMTLFGQFFDHGLDLVEKNSASKVYIPLQPDDPLITHGPDGIAGNGDEVAPSQAFMVVTRTLQDAKNVTTPFVDQNQTYTSHASHQVFLREYVADANGKPVATGHLLEGATGGLSNWGEVKAQASAMLGIQLIDSDVLNVPLLATDAYGMFERGPNGYAQVVIQTAGGPVLVEGNPLANGGLGLTLAEMAASVGGDVVRTGHAFLDDINDSAAPVVIGGVLQADADDAVGSSGQPLRDPLTGQKLAYDDELLDRHFITGDGRGNENIGLSAVHHVFHSEHNRMVEHTKEVALGQATAGDIAFLNEWLLVDLPTDQPLPSDLSSLVWDGERLFQAARFGTEMQYQHLVFEEFARKVNPMVDLFVFNPTMDVNPAIFAEFAHTVYRFGHSMLDESVDRLAADGQTPSDIGLIQAFLNPVEFDASGTTADEAAGAIIRGMTRQHGNAIDEFVTGALRNNLLGLPLDLAAINIARGRETGVPTLNDARAQLFEMTRSEWLEPYTSWTDFAGSLKNPASIINFIAAYGTHQSIVDAVGYEAKRAAATLLVLGGDGAPADAFDFLNAQGAYAGGSLGGLQDVDLWVGGLAEAILPFGGMLGSTFTAIFEKQMENLQNGDRFYYLSRTQGLHFLTELENNAFSKIIMANTDLGDENATHLPGEIFALPQYILEVDTALQNIADPVHDDPTQAALEDKVERASDNLTPGAGPSTYPTPEANVAALTIPKVGDGAADTSTVYNNRLEFNGGEHVVLGGSEQDDILIGDLGDDTLWGDGGNDLIIGGHGVNRLHGGEGDDIIYGGGDPEFLHGDEGNDAIQGGGGLGDLIFGGDGHDFIVAGIDGKEVFAAEGNDFILGTPDMDFLLGGEGDDWIEGAEGFDTLAGDNSELFFNSAVIGHDVLIAGTNENDFDAESGDDIMVQGESVMRNEGMLGFDWAIFKGVSFGADADMNVKIFTNVAADILRNRFDRTEALSGWIHDDKLVGDDRAAGPLDFNPGIPPPEQLLSGDELLSDGADRITGLRDLLGSHVNTDEAETGVAFNRGNILIGGGGNDRIEGKGGDDVIDGDAWLNVRIAVVDQNGIEIATADGIQGVFQEGNAPAAWVGKQLDALIFDRTINPGDLRIVREVLNDTTNAATTATSIVFNGETLEVATAANPETWDGDFDIALFSGARAEYDVVNNGDGSYTVTHLAFQPDGTVDPTTNGADGIDLVRNVERLQFADGALDLVQGLNSQPAGTLRLSDTTPAIGVPLTVVLVDADGNPLITDADGPAGGITQFGTFIWQEFDARLGIWEDLVDAFDGELVTGPSFTPTLDNVDALLRVRTTFVDGKGVTESVVSEPTFAVGTGDPPVFVGDLDLGAFDEDTLIDIDADALLVGVTDPDNLVILVDPPDLNAIALQLVDPTLGILTANVDADNVPDGTWTFEPSANFNGTVEFTYLVTDGGNEVQRNATLTINAVDDGPPVATDDSFIFADEDTELVIVPELDMLWNDLDPDAFDPLLHAVVIDSVASGTGGTVALDLAGNVVFTPDADFNGDATFTYTVRSAIDGDISAPATVTVTVLPLNDTATGTPTLSSNDPTEGTALTASIAGIADIDGLPAADGFAFQWQALTGGIWTDVAGATAQSFTPTQSEVNSQLRVVVTFTDLGGSLETVTSAPTAVVGDLIVGTAANNGALNGTAGADNISGLGGNDTLRGFAGIDLLDGGLGNDTLDGGTGADVMIGGAGNDRFIVDDTGDQVIETLGGGNDRVEVSADFTLAASAEVELLMVSGAVTVTANAFNQSIIGDGAEQVIDGGGGNDRIWGRAGDDTLVSGSGNDALWGEEGDDTLIGGDGNDILDGGTGIDTLIGGNGNDLVIVDNAADVVIELAGGGTDSLRALVDYTLAEGMEFETLAAVGTIQLTGNSLGQNLRGDASAQTLDGGGGDDNIAGNGGDDTLIGGAGNDLITASGGNVTLVFAPGYGNDRVTNFDANADGGQDMLDISAFGITAADFDTSVSILDLGADTLVAFGGGTVRLSGVNGNGSNVITQQDFILAT